jgi:Uma2 family endonuclease
MATTQIPFEQRIVLPNVGWDTYERLLEGREGRAPRFTYDRGALEVVSPLLPEHEELSGNLRFVVRVLAEELGISIRDFGSMTLRREDLQGGLEPDGCFYIQNEPSIRAKARPDLRLDPPPDLAIEVDITHPSLDKLPVYARFGVPELWRYAGRALTIFSLEAGGYVERAESRVLAGVTARDLAGLLEASGRPDPAAWVRRVREWERGLAGGTPGS